MKEQRKRANVSNSTLAMQDRKFGRRNWYFYKTINRYHFLTFIKSSFKCYKICMYELRHRCKFILDDYSIQSEFSKSEKDSRFAIHLWPL